MRNRLSEPTTVHWHGMRLPDASDGGPHQLVPTATLRITRMACNPSWCYEDSLMLIANSEMKPDGFVSREPDQHVDPHVHPLRRTATADPTTTRYVIAGLGRRERSAAEEGT